MQAFLYADPEGTASTGGTLSGPTSQLSSDVASSGGHRAASSELSSLTGPRSAPSASAYLVHRDPHSMEMVPVTPSHATPDPSQGSASQGGEQGGVGAGRGGCWVGAGRGQGGCRAGWGGAPHHSAGVWDRRLEGRAPCVWGGLGFHF